MSETFNPYVEWLGAQDGRRPGNHYELLGIDLYEQDPVVIARTAGALIARIRAIRPGPHLAQWRQILDELNAARTCLLNPGTKAEYDAVLRGRIGLAEPAPPSEGPVLPTASETASLPPGELPRGQEPAGPCADLAPAQMSPDPHAAGDSRLASPDPCTSIGVPQVAPRPSRRAGRKPTAARVAIFGLTVAMAVLVTIFAHMVYQKRRGGAASESAVSRPDSSRPAATAEKPARLAARSMRASPATAAGSGTAEQPARSQQPQPAQTPEPQDDAAPPGKPKPVPTQPESTATTPRQEALEKALAAARLAMSEHDLGGARRHLKAASAKVETPEHRAEIARLGTLLDHLEAFWDGMGRVVAGLEAAEAIPVGETFVAVVEASPQQLTIKVQGRLRTYRIERIPPRLVQALADMRLADDPATRVLLGAYLAVDPQGNPARARQLWEQAARQGIHTSDLLLELDNWTQASPAPQNIEETTPPTSREKLELAQQNLREMFKAEYGRATSAAGKANLAKTLLDSSQATADDADARYVLLREAHDLAVAAGDPALACRAIDEMAKLQRIDALGIKAAALGKVAESARGLTAHRATAQAALALVRQAIEAGRLDEAEQLAGLALSSARESASRTLIQQATAAGRQVEALKRKAGQTREAQ